MSSRSQKDMSTNRYERQQCLPEIGVHGQQVFRTTKVLVVGAGGLGNGVLPYLVGAGLKHIVLVDPDVVSLSNLHRQVLYKESDVGFTKVECAKRELNALNHECYIETHFKRLTSANVAQLCDGIDLVLDCADNFAVSYVLSDYCLAHNVSLVSASVLGFEGYVGGFCGGKPSLRALFPELPQRAQNCSSAGIMGPVVGMLASVQAQYALNILLKLTPSPLGQLYSIDLRLLKHRSFRFDDAQEPPIDKCLSFIDVSAICRDDWVLDLRSLATTNSDDANAATSIRNKAVHHLSIDEFCKIRPTPKNQQNAVIVCKTGLTAWRAARLLQQYWSGDIRLIALGEDPL
ncbi:HesA/MoeB/ThiF family protein [Glaciecola sp. 33A]|jgi:molybdopterin/thiamine biosynthesis adenylyltransferase|uniref:HesA/MoeB/ThiF family protein n=1 Tax=Glaciecola sp. 33A TaxID=2057807 RepID=UPI001E388B84|nr:HesA/MoeB/ThiF family protein [Glaciecola sp. 33A]